MKLMYLFFLTWIPFQTAPLKNARISGMSGSYVDVEKFVKDHYEYFGVTTSQVHVPDLKVGDSVWIDPVTLHVYKNSHEKAN